MSFNIVKFGGSNLRSAADFNLCADILRGYSQPTIAVVSAFNGLTNRLIDACNRIFYDTVHCNIFTRELSNQFYGIINDNIKSDLLRNECQQVLQDRLGQLQNQLKGAALLGTLPPYSYDQILSIGEKLSSACLTYILKDKGFDAEERLPEDIKLLTDGEQGNATVLLSDVNENVKNHFTEKKLYVVPGFYGVSIKGSVTLLGRGGSDYTASALAWCLNAKQIDIWKDVDGFKTCDPEIFPDSRTIKLLSYSESAELAYFGAKILHPRAVEPASLIGIPIRIFNIRNREGGLQTTINFTTSAKATKCVTSSKNFAFLRLLGSGVGLKSGILARVTSALERENINISSVITSQTAINILLNVVDVYRAQTVINGLNISALSKVDIHDNVAVVAIVGEGIVNEKGVASRIFRAVAQQNINVDIISGGASPVAVYFIVQKELADDAVRAIHDEFFTNTIEPKEFQHSGVLDIVI
jgi:aspartate kinase/aspartokinase/homoserine dehydrogenase 1